MDVLLGLLFGILGFFRDLFDPKQVYKLIETGITSWPLAIFALVVLLRKQLQLLFSAVKSASYKDGSREIAVNFSEGVSEVEEIIKNSDEIQPDIPPAGEFSKLEKLSKISKRSAIIEAWLSVEEAAKQLLDSHPVYSQKVRSGPPLVLERILWQSELIGPTDREIMFQLRKMRNEASHLKEFQISDEEAIFYIDNALSLADRLKRSIPEV